MTASLTTELGRVLVTGGSGFVGANLVTELLDRGHEVPLLRPRPVAAARTIRGCETVVGDITDADDVAVAVAGVDTVFHTAAIIDLMGGGSVTEEYRKRSFAVNVERHPEPGARRAGGGVKRFVYTASNSVVMGGQLISGGDETLPYTERFNDLYTETKVVAEKFVLAANGEQGMLTCSIRPSGIWGRGDQTMFRKVFESVLAGHVKVLVGSKHVKLDNSYVHNLIHGFILAAEHLVPGGTAPGQAYFINDGEPINMFEFSRPVVEACGQPWPTFRVPGRLVWHAVMRCGSGCTSASVCPSRCWNPLRWNASTSTTTSPSPRRSATSDYQPLFTTEKAHGRLPAVLRRLCITG